MLVCGSWRVRCALLVAAVSACSSSVDSALVGDGGHTAGGAGGGAGTSGAGGSGGAAGGGAGVTDGSVGCVYNGKTYRGGETFPSTDGCNTCSCAEVGVVCTKRACIPEAGAGDGPACTDTPVARLCVRGTLGSTSETIAVGDNLKIQVYPRGCFSSSCTSVVVAMCSVTGSSPFVADGRFCLADDSSPGVGCTADCNGGGFANCESPTTLTAGQRTVSLGTLSVTFTVPSTLPFGGRCDGSQF